MRRRKYQLGGGTDPIQGYNSKFAFPVAAPAQALLPNPLEPKPDLYDRMNNLYTSYVNRGTDVETIKLPDTDQYINFRQGRMNTAKIPAYRVDYAVETAQRYGVDPYKVLALMSRESTMGKYRGAEGYDAVNQQIEAQPKDWVSAWNLSNQYQPYALNRFLGDRGIPGITVNKGPHGWDYQVTDEKALREAVAKGGDKLLRDYQARLDRTPKQTENSFELAVKWLKDKDDVSSYNPGDKKYNEMYWQDYNELKQEKELADYINKKTSTASNKGSAKTTNYKMGGRLRKYNLGGAYMPTAGEQATQQQTNSLVSAVGAINPLIGAGLKLGQAVGKASVDQDGLYKNKAGEFFSNSLDPTTGIQNLKDLRGNMTFSTVANQLSLGLFGKSATQAKREQERQARLGLQRLEASKINDATLGAMDYDFYGNNEGSIYAKMGGSLKKSPLKALGGQLEPLNSNTVEVNGRTHEQGGVKVPGAELEDQETVAGDFVFSEHLGFAQRHKPIARQIGKIEKKPMNNERAASLRLLRRKEERLKMEQEGLKQALGLV